jgi:hypothetical protein
LAITAAVLLTAVLSKVAHVSAAAAVVAEAPIVIAAAALTAMVALIVNIVSSAVLSHYCLLLQLLLRCLSIASVVLRITNTRQLCHRHVCSVIVWQLLLLLLLCSVAVLQMLLLLLLTLQGHSEATCAVC